MVSVNGENTLIAVNLTDTENVKNRAELNAERQGIGFSIDDSLETPVVTVRSTTTGEVVRQIPNEVAVRVAHNIEKVKGLLFSAKA
jgi:flagellar protein FlaG